MRKLKAKDLMGKTIIDVDDDCVNMLMLSFDDETELEIYSEPGVSGISGFFVDGDEDEEDEG